MYSLIRVLLPEVQIILYIFPLSFLQKELSAILNTLELCQRMHVGCMKSSELLFEGKRQESEVSQKYCKTDTITTKAENVILFQIVSGLNISPTRNDPLPNSAYSSSMAINSAISPPFAGKSRISVRITPPVLEYGNLNILVQKSSLHPREPASIRRFARYWSIYLIYSLMLNFLIIDLTLAIIKAKFGLPWIK